VVANTALMLAQGNMCHFAQADYLEEGCNQITDIAKFDDFALSG
jgi:hypothetical protein